MADDKAGDMDFNFSDANFDMSAAGGDFEMPSMDLGDAGGDFKFDAGDDGGFNFGAADGDDAAGGTPGAAGGEGAAGGDFNFDNMSVPSFSGADDAGDKKDEPGAAPAKDSKDATPAAISMTDDPLNAISEMPDIPMSLGMSQGSSQGSQRASQGKTKSQKKSRKSKKDAAEGTTKHSSRITPAKTRRGAQTKQKDDEEGKETPAKDVLMTAQPEGSTGAKRKAGANASADNSAKKVKAPEQAAVSIGRRDKTSSVGETLRATKDMMRSTAPEPSSAQAPPQTPTAHEAKKEKKPSHKSSSKPRSSKKRPSGSTGAGAAGGANSSSHGKSDKKHKSKSKKGDSNKGSQETPRSAPDGENISLQEIVREAQSRMNEITETMTRIEKELHQKTSTLATNFVQQMFGMCNNFGMSCQQQILMMNQVAYRNDQLRKNVCKALELSNRLRGMQQMKNQLSSIKDSFCPNL